MSFEFVKLNIRESADVESSADLRIYITIDWDE